MKGLGHIKKNNLPYVFMGETNENLYSKLILERYGEDLEKTGTIYNKDKHFDTMDWVSSTTIVELKSRSINHNTFLTTMVGYNKVQLFLEQVKKGKKCVFLFAFTDGLYEWIFTEKDYEKIGGISAVKNREDFRMSEKYTSFNPTKLHLYIPVVNLVKISDICCKKLNKSVSFKSQFEEGVCYLSTKSKPIV